MMPLIAIELAVFFGAVALTALLIALLFPVLRRYALARPNARSSHKIPTPQGAGLAIVVAGSLVVTLAMLIVPAAFPEPSRLMILFACVVGLAAVGATDDIWPLEPLPRLLLQSAGVLIVVATLPDGLRVITILPWWLERSLMFMALLWLVNLVNFMDGIDWMIVAEVAPVTAALASFGLMGALPVDSTIVATALCGAIIGFAPFNKPVARLFLGDVGSLPVGLILGWLLVLLAEHHLAAALLLPLYYVADSTITLIRRLLNREQVMQAHRSHFYQRALIGGFSVNQIVSRVLLTNIALVFLAALVFLNDSIAIQALALLAGGTIVGGLLWHFDSARATVNSKT